MTMFEMLTGGELPFEGTPAEISAAKASREAPTVAQRFPDIYVPSELQAIVSKLLRRHRDERFHDAAELIAALRKVSLVDGATPMPTLAVKRGSPWRWIAAATLGVFAATFAGGWWVSHRGERDAATSEQAVAAEVAPAPVAKAAPALPPIGEVLEPAAPPPPAESVATPAPKPRPHAHGHAHHKPVPAKEAPVVEPAPERPLPAEQPAPAPVAVVAPAAPKPRPAIAGVDVHGALAVAEVQRAVDRIAAQLARCTPASPQQVVVELAIGEDRKAQGVRATGGPAELDACVATVFSAVRTESAPDVGDANVTVRVAFVVK
jgi:hypothetical protein